MKTSLARIFVQNPFCKGCISQLKNELLQVENIQHVRFFLKDALVVFNFNKANQVSEVMNILLAAGYPPKGDMISNDFKTKATCSCMLQA